MSNEVVRPIEIITQEINFYKFQAGTAIIEIGKRLLEAKQCLPHGKWGEWLQNEVEFSERTAQDYMKIAREYGNPQLIADMGNSTTKALLLLSVPASEREEFVSEAHEINGESKLISEMTTKEMSQLVKELEAERAEKEKLQAQLNLFQTEAQADKDAALDAAYKESEDKLDALMKQKEAALKAQQAAEAKIAEMETAMDELKMQAEQVVLPSDTELERIQKEAEEVAHKKVEAAMQKKLDKAKAEAEKAKKEAAEANKAIEAFEESQKEAEKNAAEAKAELERVKAEMRHKIANASIFEVYKVHLNALQEDGNKNLFCVAEALESEKRSEAEKMVKALEALCKSICQTARGLLEEEKQKGDD
mgnify:CR=1 FL=1